MREKLIENVSSMSKKSFEDEEHLVDDETKSRLSCFSRVWPFKSNTKREEKSPRSQLDYTVLI